MNLTVFLTGVFVGMLIIYFIYLIATWHANYQWHRQLRNTKVKAAVKAFKELRII